MRNKGPMSRKPFAKVLPFALGAIAASLGLVACDRRGGEAAVTAASEVPGASAAPAAVPPPPEQPVSAAPIPPREALADTVISGKVKAAILGDPAMGGSDVSVNTDHGVVVLAGLVKTPEQTAIASAYAQRQDGVMRVDNHLAPAPQ